jgi:hypothetical protein
MNSPLKIKFPSAHKAAAYAVCISEMAPKVTIESIIREEDEYVVTLDKPVQFETHQGILNFIAKDSAANPEKWKDPDGRI